MEIDRRRKGENCLATTMSAHLAERDSERVDRSISMRVVVF